MPGGSSTRVDQSTFLGRGWSFPPDFSLENGVRMVEGEEDILAKACSSSSPPYRANG